MEESSDLKMLSITVYESVSVSDTVILEVILERLLIWKTKLDGSKTIVSIKEYRQFLDDHTSTDKKITERLQYLEAFCRNIINHELQTYDIPRK